MTESNSTQAFLFSESKISEAEARKAYNAKRYAETRDHVRARQKAKRAAEGNEPQSEGYKTCTKCGTERARTLFHVGKEYPDGRKAVCKDCMQSQRRAKYDCQRDDEVFKRRTRKLAPEWQALVPERKEAAAARLAKRIAEDMPEDRCCTACASILPASTAYFNTCKTGSFGLSASCRDCIRSAYFKSARENPEKFRELARKSYAKNSKAILARAKNRRRTDLGYAIHLRVSSAVRQSLNKSRLDTSCLNLLTFSPTALKEHLESLFTKGMTWDRFLAGDIHVDHTIPVSFFNPRHPESLEFRMCWSLNNLQPLWAVDNLRKSDTLPPNFTELWNLLYNEATRYAA